MLKSFKVELCFMNEVPDNRFILQADEIPDTRFIETPQEHILCANSKSKCINKVINLIEKIIKNTIRNGAKASIPQEIKVTDLEYNFSTDTIFFWQKGSIHLPHYSPEEIKIYSNPYLLIEDDRTVNSRYQTTKKKDSYTKLLRSSSFYYKGATLFTKKEMQQIAEANLENDLQKYKILMMLIYYTNLGPTQILSIGEKDIINNCLVIEKKETRKIIPLHPVLCEFFKKNSLNMPKMTHREHQYYNDSFNTLFAKVARLSGIKERTAGRKGKIKPKHQYTCITQIQRSSQENMINSGFLEGDWHLLLGNVLKTPEDYGKYKKTLDVLFKSDYFIKNLTI